MVLSYQLAKRQHPMGQHGLRDHLSPRLTRQLVGQTKQMHIKFMLHLLPSLVSYTDAGVVLFPFFFKKKKTSRDNELAIFGQLQSNLTKRLAGKRREEESDCCQLRILLGTSEIEI